MSQEIQKSISKSGITPLFVICTFLSLTELILGVGVIQTTGGIQIALTAFVVVFPPVVAAVFFKFLWEKNHVLYAPHEYGIPSDVASFKQQMADVASDMGQKVAEAKDIALQLEELKSELAALQVGIEAKFEEAKLANIAMTIALQG